MIASKDNAYAFEAVSAELKNDREFTLEVLKAQGKAIESVAGKFLSDREVALTAISSYGGAMRHIDEKFRSDKEIILAGVNSRFNVDDIYERFPKDVTSDREFMKKVLFLDGNCFYHIDESSQKDTEFKLIKKLHEI